MKKKINFEDLNSETFQPVSQKSMSDSKGGIICFLLDVASKAVVNNLNANTSEDGVLHLCYDEFHAINALDRAETIC